MNVPPPPEIPPAFAARMGLILPPLVLAGRAFEANFGRSIRLGEFRMDLDGEIGFNILFGLLVLGAIGAARTLFMGPSRWKGFVGIALVAIAAFTSPTALEIPALRRL